jgi:sugar phosphate permease
MNMKDSVAAPLLVTLMFLVLAGLRVTWHQSAVIPGIVAVLFAARAFYNLRKRSA